jgi:hypothetical protein
MMCEIEFARVSRAKKICIAINFLQKRVAQFQQFRTTTNK